MKVSRSQKELRSKKNSMVCEISPPKIGPCENGHLLRNNFVATKCPLRNQGLAAKMALRYEIISQPHSPLCEMGCEIPKALKLQFLQPKPHFAGCFAVAKPPSGTRVPFHSPTLPFCNCEIGHWLRNGCENDISLRNHLWAAKSPFGYEITLLLRNDLQALKWLWNDLQASKWLQKDLQASKWLRNDLQASKNGCKMIFKLWNGCEMISKLRNGCEITSKLRNGCEITSKLRNGLQATKLTCEMKGGLRKHLAKPREVAKMPIEPHNHASKEESPLTEITHTKPLTPFLTSLNHQSP